MSLFTQSNPSWHCTPISSSWRLHRAQSPKRILLLIISFGLLSFIYWFQFARRGLPRVAAGVRVTRLLDLAPSESKMSSARWHCVTLELLRKSFSGISEYTGVHLLARLGGGHMRFSLHFSVNFGIGFQLNYWQFVYPAPSFRSESTSYLRSFHWNTWAYTTRGKRVLPFSNI